MGRLLAPPRAPDYASGLNTLFVCAGLIAGAIAGFVLAFNTSGGGGIFAIPAGFLLGGTVGAIVGEIVEGADRGRWYERFRPLVDDKQHVWEDAYYCTKHDVVFYADSATVWTTAEFSELITVKR